MTNIILAAIMFCMIVFLCAISFLCGFFAAVKLKMPSKTDTEPLTQEQKNDIEQKWVVAPIGTIFTMKEIEALTHFQERYFESEIFQ